MTKSNLKKNSESISINSEVKQWGNSLGVRIPKEIRNSFNFTDGSKITISIDRTKKQIIIKSLGKNSTIHDLARDLNLSDLTKKMTKENSPKKSEVVVGVRGKEIW